MADFILILVLIGAVALALRKMVRDRKGAVDSRMGQHHRAAAFPRGLSRLIDVGIFHLTQACSIRLAEKLFIERTVDGVGIAQFHQRAQNMHPVNSAAFPRKFINPLRLDRVKAADQSDDFFADTPAPPGKQPEMRLQHLGTRRRIHKQVHLPPGIRVDAGEFGRRNNRQPE